MSMRVVSRSFGCATLILAACSDMTSPAAVGLDTTYRIVGCASSTGTQATPCSIFFSGTTQVAADSGKLTFHRDGSTTFWIAQAWTNSSGTVKGITTIGGTYTAGADSIIVQASTLDNTTPGGYTLLSATSRLIFYGAIPSRVRASWTGPDSLTVRTVQQTNVILKRQ